MPSIYIKDIKKNKFVELTAIKGDTGKSAYEIWLNQGNVGTEEDFLKSLTTGSGGACNIDDVQVDGVSIVNNKVANIQLKQTLIDILVEYGLIQLNSLTEEQIQALNDMTCEIDENGELSVTYDETVLNINLQVEDGNLIIDNNINATFNINENGELEVSYE